MMDMQLLGGGDNYAPKMEESLTQSISEWWKNLTKSELLAYLADQPAVTADHLRQMLANEQCVLNVGVTFAIANNEATADFHTNVN